MSELQNLISMFPNLGEDAIAAVLIAQNNDVDKACDELLNMAVGDDLFARSVFIEEKLSASQHLQRFDKQQEEIWLKCKQEQEVRLAEQQKKDKELQQKREKEEKLRKQREEEEKLRREEQKRIIIERQEREAKRLEQEKQAALLLKQKLDAEKAALNAEKEATSAKLKAEAEAQQIQLERERLALEAEKLKIQAEKDKIAAEREQLLAQQTPPKISIYTRKHQEDKEYNQDNISNEIKDLFISSGFKNEEIKVMDVSHDMELASFLKNICGDLDNIKYPLVCAGNLPIGTIDQVKALVNNSEQLTLLHEGKYVPDFLTDAQTNSLKDGTGVFVGQGVLDHCLDAAEYVISGVSSLLWLPVSLVTYPFRSEKEELQKGPDDVDFDIVHTNWYWRNLKRRFRFTQKAILRIHPTHNDIRASHLYDSILTIKVIDDKSIVINYNDGSSPDYVCATPEGITTMIDIIQKRAKTKPVILRESEL